MALNLTSYVKRENPERYKSLKVTQDEADTWIGVYLLKELKS